MINLHIKADELKKKLDIRDGLPGRDGIDGKDGVRGKDGLNGKDGKDGFNGIDGVNGKPGRDGLDGSPDTAEQVRDKLETLEGEDRLDSKHIKNLPKWIKEKGKDMLVGGIRFFENLADVSIDISVKRQDMIAQYNQTNKRWQNGIAITVSDTAPTDPEINDLWVNTA